MSAKSSSGAGKHPYARDNFRGTESTRRTFARINKPSAFPTLPFEPWDKFLKESDALQRKKD
jgi:hypothetical protein